MEQPVFPYIDRELTSFVELEAYKLNSEIKENILEKLRETEEGRCNEYGYIAHVVSILEIHTCEIRPEDLNANTVFRVRYSCIICRPECTPQHKDILLMRIKQTSNSLIAADNGPMRAIIQTDHVDRSSFDVHGDAIVHKLTSKRLEVGMLIRMKVIGIKFHVYDTNIKMIGSLVDIGHDEDEDLYFYDHNNDPTQSLLRNKINRSVEKADRFVDDEIEHL